MVKRWHVSVPASASDDGEFVLFSDYKQHALHWVSSEMPRSGELVLIECRQQYNRVSPPYPPPWIICCGYYDADTGKWRSGSHYTLAIQVRRWCRFPVPPPMEEGK